LPFEWNFIIFAGIAAVTAVAVTLIPKRQLLETDGAAAVSGDQSASVTVR
jgi:MFS transporter, AAHS family, benzoate transport protein